MTCGQTPPKGHRLAGHASLGCRANRLWRSTTGHGRLWAMSVAHDSPVQPRQDVARGIAARAAQIGVMFVVIGGRPVRRRRTARLDLGLALPRDLPREHARERVVPPPRPRSSSRSAANPARCPAGTRPWGVSGASPSSCCSRSSPASTCASGGRVRSSVAWHLAGALVFAAGLALFGWAMIANAYFSTVARIQPERGQTVCSGRAVSLRPPPGLRGGDPPVDRVAAPARLGLGAASRAGRRCAHGGPHAVRGPDAAGRAARLRGLLPPRSPPAGTWGLVSGRMGRGGAGDRQDSASFATTLSSRALSASSCALRWAWICAASWRIASASW